MGFVAESSVALLCGSSDGGAMVNSFARYSVHDLGRRDSSGRLSFPLEEGPTDVVHDVHCLLLELLSCDLLKLEALLTFDLGKAEIKLGQPRAEVVEVVAHVDGEDAHHPLHLSYHDGGGRGHRIDVVSGYQV